MEPPKQQLDRQGTVGSRRGTTPDRDAGALRPCGRGAPRALSQFVARLVGAPSDHRNGASQRRVMRTAFTHGVVRCRSPSVGRGAMGPASFAVRWAASLL